MDNRCRYCGCDIPDDAPATICPACELRGALSPIADVEGGTIGNYKIVSVIGSGGFGVVYLANQSEPVRRQVALKVLKREHLSESAIAQFVSEQQALAVLNHPNIAKIYDAGTTSSGVPYFVMELVEGEPVTTYCDRKRLTPNDRILLFREICGAIQHAHQKAIIHRDIKPSNVLVVEIDDRPVPKIIDFGVAKALGAPLHEGSLGGPRYAVIGTPEYMPPEQARGATDVDTRADIYSLGVLFYELLIGMPPFSRKEFHDAGMAAILKKIEKERPPSPSERLAKMPDHGETIAENRHVEPPELKKMIRGDLDWIVMKAIEKNRRGRYQSTSALTLDIDSYLEDRPLPTRRRTAFYLIRKFCRRNRAAVGAAAAILIVSVVAAVLTSSLLAKERQVRADALYTKLFDCRVEHLPAVVAEIQSLASRLDDRLRSATESGQRPPLEKARASIALLPREPTQLEPLSNWLFQAPPGDLGIYLGMLEGSRTELANHAWSVLTDTKADRSTQLHAAAIGAFADPESPRWAAVSDQIAAWLTQSGPFGAVRWLPLLEPLADWFAPALRQVYLAERDSDSGVVAALVLAELAAGDTAVLCALAREAGRRQLAIVADVFARDRAAAEAALASELAEPVPTDAEDPLRGVRERARIGISLLLIGKPEAVWPQLAHRPNPELRTRLIHTIAPYGVDWRLVSDGLAAIEDPGIVSGLVAALGAYDSGQLPPSMRSQELRPRLESLFVGHRDPGVRSAAEWLLHRWGLDESLRAVDVPNRGPGPAGDKRWYVTPGGEFTMAVLPAPIAFTMGSSESELDRAYERGHKPPDDEKSRPIELGHTVAIATKEVTFDQFMEFATATGSPDKVLTPNGWSNPISRTGDAAMSFVSLREAMLYCRWLSERDGIPEEEQCYQSSVVPFDELKRVLNRLRNEADPDSLARFDAYFENRMGGDDLETMREKLIGLRSLEPSEGTEKRLAQFALSCYRKLDVNTVPGYLSKSGYRIMTEAEWEFACRGGTATARYFGSDLSLLPEYAWFNDNGEDQARRPGLLRPNPYGLFDMLGNVTEWCQDPYRTDYEPESAGSVISVDEDWYGTEKFVEGSRYVYRGGSFFSSPRNLRAAHRVDAVFSARPSTGFRIARTIQGGE